MSILSDMHISIVPSSRAGPLYTSLERIVDKPIDDTAQQVYSSSFVAVADVAENLAVTHF
jgi:hypothetical protein